MNCKKLLSLVLLLPFFFSCQSKKYAELQDSSITELHTEPQQEKQKRKEQPQIPTGKTPQTFDSTETKSLQTSSAYIDWDKKIIKTATLKLEVKGFKDYASNIYSAVKKFGGYIAEETQNTSEEKIESTLTIKVPVAQFETVMNELPGANVKVIEKNISAEDVTSEVVDVKGRLETKRQMRQKYFEFFKQAKNMEEVLQVQSEINDLQEAMESAEGRVNYLTHQSAMSTIHLTFYQPLEGFKDSTPTYISRIGDAFITGAKWMGNILVGLVAIWPLLLAFIVGIFLLRKFTSPKTKQPNS